MGFLTLGQGLRQQHPRPDRRPDRHGHPRVPGPDRRLCPLPRPQVRRDSHGRLLFALRGLRQQRGAARAPADRPARHPRPQPTRSRSRSPAKRRELRQFLDSQYKLLAEAARQRTPDYLVRAATTAAGPARDGDLLPLPGPRGPAPSDRRAMAAIPRRSDARPDDPVFGPWHDLMALPDADFAARGQRRRSPDGITRPAGTQPGQLNPMVAELLEHAASQVQGRCRPRLWRADPSRRRRGAGRPPRRSRRPRSTRRAAQIRGDPGRPREPGATSPRARRYYYMSRGEKDAFGGKLTELDRMTVKAADASPRAMVLFDAEELYEPQIFVRGNPSQPGDRVPRQFLRVVAGAEPPPVRTRQRPARPGRGRSRRRRIRSPRGSSSTGSGCTTSASRMVSTPSDFGTRSTPPTHPELLDYLAARLQQEGWSLKALHRMIVLSSDLPAGERRPARMPAGSTRRTGCSGGSRGVGSTSRRCATRSCSSRAGSITKMGGRPVDVAGDPKNGRRTVYGLVDRQSLPAMFRAFDFASPDQSAERRPADHRSPAGPLQHERPLRDRAGQGPGRPARRRGGADDRGTDRRALPRCVLAPVARPGRGPGWPSRFLASAGSPSRRPSVGPGAIDVELVPIRRLTARTQVLCSMTNEFVVRATLQRTRAIMNHDTAQKNDAARGPLPGRHGPGDAGPLRPARRYRLSRQGRAGRRRRRQTADGQHPRGSLTPRRRTSRPRQSG